MPNKTSATDAFRQALMRNHDLALSIDQPDFPLQPFLAIQDWQRKRFKKTYEDFLAAESSRPACRFFLNQLYGGLDFRQRDAQVEEVAPLMIRLLPDKALLALSEALKLQAISLQLDRKMAEEYLRVQPASIDAASYAKIYRHCGQQKLRRQQLALIRKLGGELQNLTQMPLLLKLVKAMRQPALAAGYGRLQNFLEEGLAAFKQLEHPREFVNTIYLREQELMAQWLDAHPDRS
jgi:hypothetical protein